MNLLGPNDNNIIEVQSEKGIGSEFSFYIYDKNYDESSDGEVYSDYCEEKIYSNWEIEEKE